MVKQTVWQRMANWPTASYISQLPWRSGISVWSRQWSEGRSHGTSLLSPGLESFPQLLFYILSPSAILVQTSSMTLGAMCRLWQSPKGEGPWASESSLGDASRQSGTSVLDFRWGRDRLLSSRYTWYILEMFVIAVNVILTDIECSYMTPYIENNWVTCQL